MTKSILLVGLGGAGGSILRYLAYVFINKNFTAVFPAATFTVNFLGSFLIGILIGILEKQTSSDLRLLLVTGFCGGFTTFSTFAFDNINLLQSHHVTTAMVYSAVSLFTCIVAVWLALLLMK